MLENIWIRVEFAQQFGFLFEEREGLENPAAEAHHENYHERVPEEITTVAFYFLQGVFHGELLFLLTLEKRRYSRLLRSLFHFHIVPLGRAECSKMRVKITRQTSYSNFRLLEVIKRFLWGFGVLGSNT